MNVTAADAYKITEETYKPVDAWDKLFEKIKERAENGFYQLCFDEETEGVRFKEERKEVKRKLEELGYIVTYSRQLDANGYFGQKYHNFYRVSWDMKDRK